MTYAYYHNVVKGKSPKNAPTYLPEDEEGSADATEKWVCSICKYEYDGDIPLRSFPIHTSAPYANSQKVNSSDNKRGILYA